MSDKPKLHFFNPVDHLETNEEMIEYLVECYFEDPEGKTYQRACEFLGASKSLPTLFTVIARATKEIAERQSNAEKFDVNLANTGVLKHA